MPDRDDAPDPIDKAYVQAETLLHDEAGRAARRARVLAAVASAPAAEPAAPTPPRHGLTLWRGGWLAAAGVAGLALVLASQMDPTAWRRPLTLPTAASPTEAASKAPPAQIAASPPSSAKASATAPPRPALAAPQVAAPAPAAPVSPPEPAPAAPPPPPVPAPQAFPAAPAAPAPSPSAVIITSERRAHPPEAAGADEAGDAQDLARGPAKAAAAPAPPPSGLVSSAALASDRTARLRAAAAAGRTGDVEALLGQGIPVDAPDANGDTALMQSIQADHPAAAALLRRHGASLDRRNHAGRSARDMATAKGDAELDQALGLEP